MITRHSGDSDILKATKTVASGENSRLEVVVADGTVVFSAPLLSKPDGTYMGGWCQHVRNTAAQLEDAFIARQKQEEAEHTLTVKTPEEEEAPELTIGSKDPMQFVQEQYDVAQRECLTAGRAKQEAHDRHATAVQTVEQWAAAAKALGIEVE